MRFRWHAQAQAIGPEGAAHAAGQPSAVPVVVPPSPGIAALQNALGAPAFRIGGDGAPPQGDGMMETLTGGSSGTPRRIRRTHTSWIASFSVNAGLFGIGPGVSVACLGGLEHSLALYASVEALHLGATLHLLAGLRPDRQARALAMRRVQVVYATPAQMQGLLAAGGDWPNLAHLVLGGARLTPALRAAIAERSPCRITEFYGAAETSFIALAGPEAPEGSLGRPYPGAEIRCDQGRLWVRSPYLAAGYAGVPGGALWQNGWVAPGEAGRLEDGFLWLEGRIGRQVKIADQTVQPEEIEAALAAIPGIEAAAVLPRPDATRGMVLWAYAKGAGDTATILARLRAAFGPLKAPKRLIWVQDWPALPSGKTDFQALEARL